MVAGVRGSLDLLNAGASFLEVTKKGQPRPEYCGKVDLGYGLGFDVVAKAWAPGWGDEDASSSTVAAYLSSLGYRVTSGTAMPEKPFDHGQIWAFGVYDGYPDEVLDGLAQYMRLGGSVMINSEHECCDVTNRDVETLLDRVLKADVGLVTGCTDPCEATSVGLAERRRLPGQVAGPAGSGRVRGP